MLVELGKRMLVVLICYCAVERSILGNVVNGSRSTFAVSVIGQFVLHFSGVLSLVRKSHRISGFVVCVKTYK